MLQARLLNSLSLIELNGAQKIARRLAKLPKSNFVLEHLAEEFRHAQYLRKLAHKVSGGVINSYLAPQILLTSAHGAYLNNLERRVCVTLKKHGLHEPSRINERCYLLTSYLVELRALPFYRSLQKHLELSQQSVSLNSIICEEEDHLNEIEMMIDSQGDLASALADCISFEAPLFDGFLKTISDNISANV